MFNLVLKDLYINKKYLIKTILYGLPIFIITFFTREAIYNVAPFMYAYSFSMYALGYGEKNDVDIMLNSLPVRKIDIVLSNYLSMFIFFVVSIAITQLFSIPLKLSGLTLINRMMNYKDIIISFVAIIIYSSIYLPFYFKFGYLKSQIINSWILISTLFFLIILNMIISFINNGTARSWIIDIVTKPSFNYFAVVCTIGASLIILVMSIFISIAIYSNKNI